MKRGDRVVAPPLSNLENTTRKVEHLNIKSPGNECQGFCISYC